MSIHVCCFSDSRMRISQRNLVESAKRFGADHVHVWTDENLSEEFTTHFGELLKQEKGYGYYCWKPYVVMMTLLKYCVEGDILFYFDAGNTIIEPLQYLVQAIPEHGILLFSNGFSQMEWTKMDTTMAINGEPLEMSVRQCQASTIAFRVGKNAADFIREWYLYSHDIHLIDNTPSIAPNCGTFAEHRWDQSILTAVSINWGIEQHWFPSDTNWHRKADHPNDHYPSMFTHHRKRDSEWY